MCLCVSYMYMYITYPVHNLLSLCHCVLQVLALVCLIACAAAQDDVSSDEVDDNLLDRSNAASGWGIFLCFIALLTESVFILLRFLGCGFIAISPRLSILVVSVYQQRSCSHCWE